MQGSLRVTDTTYTTDLNLAGATASKFLKTDTNKNLVSADLPTATTSTAGILKLTDSYTSTDGSNATTGKALLAALQTLDSSLPSGSSAAKTLTGLTITDGKIASASFTDISITAAQASLGNVTNDAQVKASLGTAKGDMLYWSAADTPARLANGDAFTILTAGSTTDKRPTWTSTAATLTSTTSIVSNTHAYATLTLGNNAGYMTTTAHSEGRIVLYSSSTAAHTLVGASTGTAYTSTLPNNTGILVSLSGGTAKGSASKPIYVPATGIVTECSTYAGGTAVTLNGTSKAASTASFYAPTSAGTAGYALTSQGSGEPDWYGGLTLAGTTASDYVATFSGTTASTNPTTGAVVVSGGLGVGGDIHVNSGIYTSAVTSYNTAAFISSSIGDPWPFIRFDTRAGGTDFITTDAAYWGQLYCRVPAKRASNSEYFSTGFMFREYSKAANTTTRLDFCETYYLPTVDDDRTTSVSYDILTTKDLSFSITGNAATATSAHQVLRLASNETVIGADSTPANATNNELWINYRSGYGGTTTDGATKLIKYYFGNRKGSTADVTLYAENFSSTGNIKTGRINCFPTLGTNSYNEGIRIHSSSGNWATIMLCGTDNTGDTGTSANSWGLFNNSGNFYISKNGSSSSSSAYIANKNNVWSFHANDAMQFLTTSGAAQAIKTGGLVSSYIYTDNAGPGVLVLDRNTTSATETSIFFYRQGTARAGLTFEAQPITYSSRERKKNILPLKTFGDEIDQLNLVSFSYKEDSDEQINYGLIYEDTIDVLPYICITNPDAVIDKGISYERLIPIMLKEIQELRKRVKTLEEQLSQN